MPKPTEEWRPVVGFEKHYEVSNLGRVRVLPRIRVMRWWDRFAREERTREVRIGDAPRLLKPKTASAIGYPEVW